MGVIVAASLSPVAHATASLERVVLRGVFREQCVADRGSSRDAGTRLRLSALLMILGAIFDKNRTSVAGHGESRR